MGGGNIGLRLALVNAPGVVFYMCEVCRSLYSILNAIKGYESPESLITVVKKKMASAYRECDSKYGGIVLRKPSVTYHIVLGAIFASTAECAPNWCVIDREKLRQIADCLCSWYWSSEKGLTPRV